jgi:hypothetical protein
MRSLVVLTAIAATLAIAAPASAGGWASVGFEPLPDGVSAGSTWSPTIFVKQHGTTPLAGLQPVVTIHDERTGAETRFLAEETSEVGAYRADVVFPTRGDWRVTILSGFGDSQATYGPVAIGPAGSADTSSFELPAVGIGIALAALLGGIALVVARRLRRLTPASS